MPLEKPTETTNTLVSRDPGTNESQNTNELSVDTENEVDGNISNFFLNGLFNENFFKKF